MGLEPADGFDGEDQRLVKPVVPNMYPPYCNRVDENYVLEGDIEYPFEDISGPADENKIRGNWSSSVDYYLAVFSFTFGLGNLWRFPYQWSVNGGIAYLIPYCVMFLLTSLPIIFMEFALGQFISLGPIAVWKVAPLFKGIGISMVFLSCIIAVYYNMITSWALHYLVNSVKAALPWATCNNHWNSENCTAWNRGAVSACMSINGTMLVNGTCLVSPELISEYNASGHAPVTHGSGILPSAEYFHREVLMLSSGITDFQTVNWQLAICLLVAWTAVFLASFKGIKTSGKVVYVTAMLPYIILFVMFIRFLTLPGSIDGLMHFFKPKWHLLLDLRIWGEAAVQVFYSLSSCTGGLTMLSSYNRFHNNIFRDIWIFGLIDLLTSFLMTSFLFAAVGFVCYELNMDYDQFKLQDGVQLIFVFFSEAISKLPVAQLWSAFFFGMIALVMFNTELFVIETIVSSICDEFPERLRRNHRHLLTFVVFLFYILGLPLCTAAGVYWIVFLEAFTASWPLIIIAFLECMVICWVYGVDNFLDNVKWMTRFYPPVYLYWRVLWKYLCPIMFMAILSFVWLEYKPVHYDSVSFPMWAHCVGWAISLSPIIITFFVAIIKFIMTPGSCAKRWRDLLCPDDDWGPALAIHRAEMYPLQIPEARKLLNAKYVFQPPSVASSEKPTSTTDLEPKGVRQRASRGTTTPKNYSLHPSERETII
uniref:Transporter n=1 Tax=Panagrellus redivivus TaxID=6233 RepID=A0A7E4V3A1_PANRE